MEKICLHTQVRIEEGRKEKKEAREEEGEGERDREREGEREGRNQQDKRRETTRDVPYTMRCAVILREEWFSFSAKHT